MQWAWRPLHAVITLACSTTQAECESMQPGSSCLVSLPSWPEGHCMQPSLLFVVRHGLGVQPGSSCQVSLLTWDGKAEQLCTGLLV